MKTNQYKLLLVRVPSCEAVDARELRDYILESLERGVLVLTEDASCEVLELPALGGVEVAAEPQAPPSQTGVAEGTSEGDEKREILRRLTEYRKVHGLGSLEAVSVKTAHNKSQRIPADKLRSLLVDGASPGPMEEWQKISRALDKLEQEKIQG